MTTYVPFNTRTGQRGPRFEYATLACLWIIQQDKPSEWTWEATV